MQAVADTSPLRYLLVTDLIDLLPQLFERVTIPAEVQGELLHASAPAVVREWASHPPTWLHVARVAEQARHASDAQLRRVDLGERAAILLAEQLQPNVVLIDDRLGRKIAIERGLPVTGLLGLLSRAAARDLVDLRVAVTALRQAGFHASPALLRALLDGSR